MTIVIALLGIMAELLVSWLLMKAGEKYDDQIDDP